jgi:HK97 gp10 family phage protein
MSASHNFNANQLRERIIAVLNFATLEVMVQMQTELQLMVSQPGRGRLYAKTAQGVRNLSRFLDDRAGLSRKNAQRIDNARWLRQAQGKREQSMQAVIGPEAAGRFRSTQRIIARRVGVQLGESRIQRLIGGNRSLGDMGIHRASAPGDPPTVRTGRLRRGIQMARPNRYRAVTRVGWRIGVKVNYAPFLEFGTRRMSARPFIKPVLTKMKTLGPRMITNRLKLSGLYGVNLT